MSLSKVSEAVVWAWASGSDFVSLYDVSGHLKRRHFDLLTEIRRTLAKYRGDDLWARQFRLEFHPHLESENWSDVDVDPNVVDQVTYITTLGLS
jgi:hypothetical protein